MIETYVQEILAPWLASKGLDRKAVKAVTADVRWRLISALSYMTDYDRFLALMFAANEESRYYEPYDAPQPVRMLVGTCIRNSLVEDWHCPAAGQAALLHDSDMRELTTEAVIYFEKRNITAFQRRGGALAQSFDHLADQFPAAWGAFETLANRMKLNTFSSDASVRYDPIEPRNMLIGFPDGVQTEAESSTLEQNGVVLSGMSPVFDPTLLRILWQLSNDRLDMFFAPNFKMMTRNLEKLLSIVEWVFACGKPLVTINYYLSNGLVQRRHLLWRPAHNRQDVARQLADPRLTCGLEKEHLKLLRAGCIRKGRK